MEGDDIVLSSKQPRSRPRHEAGPDGRHLKWTCSYCGRRFAKAEHHHRHMLTHTKQRPYRCSICLKSFSRQDTLSRHGRTHQPAEAEAAASDNSLLATPPAMDPYLEAELPQNGFVEPSTDTFWDTDAWAFDLAAFNDEVAGMIAGPFPTEVEQRSVPPTFTPDESCTSLARETVEEKWFTYLSHNGTGRTRPTSEWIGRGGNDLNEQDRTSMRLSLRGTTASDVLPSTEFLVCAQNRSAGSCPLTLY